MNRIASSDLPPAPAGTPWDDVRRLARRIGFLRTRGQTAEADTLEAGALAQALHAARTAGGPAVIDEATLLAAETERAAAAGALAELITPVLVECLRAELSGRFIPPPVAQFAAVARPTPPPSPNRIAPTEASTPPCITDLIDGMLRLEHLSASAAR